VVVCVVDLLMTLSFVLEDRTVPRKAIQETLPRPTLVLSPHILMTLEIVIGLHWQESIARQILVIPPCGVVATL